LSFSRSIEGDESLVNGTNFDNGVLMRRRQEAIGTKLITHAKPVPQKRRLSAAGREGFEGGKEN
jgi:hypothetical protein